MKAGIKLDKKLHKNLFGESIDLPPRYSKDWASCGRIIGRLTDEINFIELSIEEEVDSDDAGNEIYFWKVVFNFNHSKMSYCFKGEAATIPLAVCRAALEFIRLS